MAKLFKFEVITPIGTFYEDEVNYIKFTAENGEMGVLANHAPTIVATKACILEIKKESEEKKAFISQGFVEISKEKVSIVVDLADWSENLDEETIKKMQISDEKLEHRHHDIERKVELKASINKNSFKG